MEVTDSIKDILNDKGIYTGLTMGSSMWPLIHQQRDNIIVVKNKGRLKKYDVPVYTDNSGRYIMHRVIEVREKDYVIVGDNLLVKEYVPDEKICGVLVGFYKNGKKYIDCQNSRLYKAYSKIWVALLPVRPVILFVHRGFSWLSRHLFKRGEKS